jgi:hypothetical protein
MNEIESIKKELDILKNQIRYPDLYIFDYLSEIKREIDLSFTNTDQHKLWIQMIEKLKLHEQKCQSNLKNNQTIKSIMNELESIDIFETDLSKITNLIDDLRYRFEQNLFMQKTFIYLIRSQKLICIENEYLRSESIALIK